MPNSLKKMKVFHHTEDTGKVIAGKHNNFTWNALCMSVWK